MNEESSSILSVQNLVKHYRQSVGGRGGKRTVHALCGVSFEIPRRSTFGVVGESGSGKTTLLRTVLGLEKSTSGAVVFNGTNVTAASRTGLAEFRRLVSVVSRTRTPPLIRDTR